MFLRQAGHTFPLGMLDVQADTDHDLLADALEALIVLGQLVRAEALLEAFEARALDVRATAVAGRCRGLLLLAHGDLDAAAVALDSALVRCARAPMPLDHARTLLVRGVVARRAGRRTSATSFFERAIGEFELLGALAWARMARDELSRVGLRRGDRHELTEGERQVARLAGGGLTNREVAQALYISPKTVEANLSRAYRKLGIRSRAELGACMAAGHAATGDYLPALAAPQSATACA